MKAVILESYAVHEGDMHWETIRPFVDELVVYPTTAQAEIPQRLAGAQLAVINKCRMEEATLAQCPDLKWLGIIATGTDAIDLEACRRRGVKVANVPGYSSYSVAQLAFSMLLSVCQCTARYDAGVRDGYWKQPPAQYGILPLRELYGKTFGILGYGDIGRCAARMAQGFGMKVLAATRTACPECADDGVTFTDWDTLLADSDVLSLHCPLTPQTREILGAESLAKMKRGAILINTARGGLVNESDVAAACRSGQLAWYLADAFLSEPLSADSPLRQAENIILTPHIGWATAEALERLEAVTIQNMKSFIEGKPEHIVNP